MNTDALISGSADGTVCLWDIQEDKPQKTLKEHNGWNNALSISRNGRFLASASDNNAIRLWSLPEDELLRTLEVHTDSVSALSMSPISINLRLT